MNDTVLLVDDERDIVYLLDEVLRNNGINNIRRAYSGLEAIELCREFNPDVVILDVMLPDIDGIEVCKKIREFSHCSILFLSSKNDDVDKILGLASGGDDYVTKPFSPKEIVYRVKAQLRRMRYAETSGDKPYDSVLTVGDLTLDRQACAAYKDGKAIDLTAKEYGLLAFLMENPNKIISKNRIYESVWDSESAICDNTIMVHIRHLREKIEPDASNPKLLLTVKGLGYKLTDGKAK